MTRKLILILVGGVVVLAATAVLRVSQSNDRRLDAAHSDQSTRTRVDPSENADEDAFEIRRPRTKTKGTPEQRPSATLRQRFVELATERAKRMSDDELGQAVEQITKQIADQDTAAETELNKATEQLKSVAATFPGTPSAERANRALEAIETIKVRPSKKALPPRALEEEADPFQDGTN
jgi:hypothetical protein